MHPILARTERLTLYLGGWLIVSILLGTVGVLQGLTWMGALVFLVPITIVYGFISLSAWYVCGGTPLTAPNGMRALASSSLAALVASGLWTGLAHLWINVLSSFPAFAPAEALYRRQTPLLFASGVLLYLLAVAIHYLLLAFENARESERRQLQLEVLARDAELRALRAQIDPHFLYNSLNSINALTGSDPAGARRMCVLLGDFLRNTLKVGARERIPLADELVLTDGFLNIEQVRFGSRLQVERVIDPTATQCLVPPLLLQPLVENAITHGIAKTLEGGVIRLDVARNNGRLSIAIQNPRDSDDVSPGTGGVGLENVRRRLETMFGNGARMDTHADASQFRVELSMPWVTEHNT
jgi:sensor histidine kinase YesM